MSTKNTADIDDLIKELEHYQISMNDRSLGSGFWDQAVKDFIRRHSGHIVSLLEELARTRGKTLINAPASNLHRITVEGRDAGNPAKALSAALNKAIINLSDLHDNVLILRELSELPEGGYRGTLEIHSVPLSSKDGTLHDDHDKNLKHIHEHEYGKKLNREHIKYPIFDHFAGTDDDGQADMPEYILINVDDPSVMNYMIGKNLFEAGLVASPATADGTPPPQQVIVRVRRPRMALAS